MWSVSLSSLAWGPARRDKQNPPGNPICCSEPITDGWSDRLRLIRWPQHPRRQRADTVRLSIWNLSARFVYMHICYSLFLPISRSQGSYLWCRICIYSQWVSRAVLQHWCLVSKYFYIHSKASSICWFAGFIQVIWFYILCRFSFLHCLIAEAVQPIQGILLSVYGYKWSWWPTLSDPMIRPSTQWTRCMALSYQPEGTDFGFLLEPWCPIGFYEPPEPSRNMGSGDPVLSEDGSAGQWDLWLCLWLQYGTAGDCTKNTLLKSTYLRSVSPCDQLYQGPVLYYRRLFLCSKGPVM